LSVTEHIAAAEGWQNSIQVLNVACGLLIAQLQIPDLELFSATDLAQVKAVFAHHAIQHMFMGAGLELEQRIEIVRTVFQESKTTTVRLKDVASGPQGFFPSCEQY
jgi:hypothetical protein